MYKLLIVEDNPRDMRYLLETIPFEEWGLNVVGTASNGEEAIALVENLEPDIILTDIAMPIVNGIEMAQILSIKHPAIKILFMSYYDDFSFAKSAIELMIYGYILKPINQNELRAACEKLVAVCARERDKSHADAELIAQLESSIPILRQAFLQELLSGTGLNEQMIRERLQFLHVRGADFCKVAVISVRLPSDDIASAQYAYLNRLSVENNLAIQTNYYNAHVVYGAMYPSVILFLSGGSDDVYRQLLLSYVTKVWKYLDGKADFGISMLSDKAGDLSALAKQACDAIKTRFYSSESPFIFYADIAFEYSDDKTDTLGIMNLKREIDEKIFMGEVRGADAFIDIYLNDQLADEVYIKSLSYSILNILMLMLTEKGLNYPPMATNEWNSKRLWQKLHSFKSADDLRQWIKDIIYSIQGFIEAQSTNRYRELVKAVKSIIEIRYGEQLSVSDIANAVYLSPKQTNAIFKREEGLSIFDYLIDFRMGKAKKLLKETNHTIQSIAEMVGYSNKSHFAIMFKRNIGLSPSEYRNRPVI